MHVRRRRMQSCSASYVRRLLMKTPYQHHSSTNALSSSPRSLTEIPQRVSLSKERIVLWRALAQHCGASTYLLDRAFDPHRFAGAPQSRECRLYTLRCGEPRIRTSKPVRAPVFKTGAIAVLPALLIFFLSTLELRVGVRLRRMQ